MLVFSFCATTFLLCLTQVYTNIIQLLSHTNDFSELYDKPLHEPYLDNFEDLSKLTPLAVTPVLVSLVFPKMKP